jgi:3-deoxy-D-manno-octulosonate 8-phosphate phosphatase (KDO 8-P phosphatase)
LTNVARPELDRDLAERFRRVRLVAFDFDGVFTDNTVFVFADGTEAVRCWRSDGLGLKKLPALGVGVIVLSTEENPIVSVRTKKLGIRCLQGLADKLGALETVLSEANLTLADAAYVGNDINDLACLEAVGLPIVVDDAHPDVIRYARYRTRARGGRGAVREVCDLFEYSAKEPA